MGGTGFLLLMPELPEVEILTRHLRPLLRSQTVRGVQVLRKKVLGSTPLRTFQRALRGATFEGLERRGKYLLFQLRSRSSSSPLRLVGHLGMTGRMFLAGKRQPLPKHAAVVFDLGRNRFIYEDPRLFGRMTLNDSALAGLGPEPLGDDFHPKSFWEALQRSRQAIKVKLLDQSLVAGVGNIYASEALFHARISPVRAAHQLTAVEGARLWRALRHVLAAAIRSGSRVPLNFTGGQSDGLFYFGRAPGTTDHYGERLRVYGRAGQPCPRCGTPLRRGVQAARSTFYCPDCQI